MVTLNGLPWLLHPKRLVMTSNVLRRIYEFQNDAANSFTSLFCNLLRFRHDCSPHIDRQNSQPVFTRPQPNDIMPKRFSKGSPECSAKYSDLKK